MMQAEKNLDVYWGSLQGEKTLWTYGFQLQDNIKSDFAEKM
jgi:hypothetical protein